MFNVGITVPAVFNGSVIDGIERAAAAGVDGIEFFDWEAADFDALSAAADTHDIEIYGTLAAGAGQTIMDPDAPALADPDSHDRAVADIERSIEAAATLGCATLIVTVGQNVDSLDDATQQTAIVDAVDSPNVKLLFDIYHQQITEGDVVRRLSQQIQHIGHIHAVDNPGRHEPGTGELAYERIFAAIADLEYDGYVSAEFMPEGDPDMAAQTFADLADDTRQ
jgi:hydroxypyruvate isomerase